MIKRLHLFQFGIILIISITSTLAYKNNLSYSLINDKKFECTIVQGGYSGYDYNLIENYPALQENVFNAYMGYVKSNIHKKLLVIPESAFPNSHQSDDSITQKLQDIAKENSMNIYANYLLNGENEVFNSVVLINKEGRIEGTYNKTNPMYFYETKILERGNNASTFKIDGYTIAPLICFDVVFISNFYRKQAPDLYIVTSNDVFAENTVLARLHQAYSVINARTMGRPLLQVVQNGPSFYVNKKGEYRNITKPYEIVKGLDIKIE